MSDFSISCLFLLIILFGWGSYFYTRHTRRQSPREIFKIFALGMLSILPVLLFHQWLLDQFVIKLREIWPVLAIPFLSATLELSLLVIFIIIFIGIFSLFHSLSLRVFYHLPWRQSFKTIYNRIYNLTPILLFFVLFLLLEGIFNLTNQQSFVLSLSGSTIVFAVLEEYFKYIINPFLVYKKIDSIRTAMIHAIYVGLAFAFIENLLFFYVNTDSPDFQNIVLYRTFFTTLLHVGVSGFLGYFYGISLFAETMLTNYEIEKSPYYSPFWLRGLFKKTAAFRSLTITQGFFLAALFHALFNLLLHLGMIKTASVLAVSLTLTTILLLHSKMAKIQYGLIGGRSMPSADFEKLRLQISVLEHLGEIQKSRDLSSSFSERT